MRVTVHLHDFFDDHRAQAKIFIHKKIKFIRDVESHIGRIFGIENFCLKCNDDYLPPDEDVQLLTNDDIIRVVALKQKKKKKKQSKDENFKTNNDCEEMEQDTEVKSKKKHKKSEGNNKQELEKNTSIEQMEISDKNCDNVKVKAIINEFENKKDFSPLLNKPYDKKINIVKTIILSNNKKSPEHKEEDNNICIENNTLEMSLNGQETEGSVSTMSEQKRKRKRTHKRRNKNIIQETVFPILSDFTPKVNLVKSPTHLRFDDVVENGKDTIQEEANVTNHEEQTVNNEKIVNEKQDTIQEEANVINHEEQTVNNEKNGDINITETLKGKDLEDLIIKQPIISNTTPRVDEVLAFKIVRLTENYTPEVSTLIVGKVKSYNSESKRVEFEITHGKDQCVPPQGKFTVEVEEGQEENSIFECFWPNLLEPRLIFP